MQNSIKETNSNIILFTAKINALAEVLGLTTDQILDWHNLTNKILPRVEKEFRSRSKLG